MSSVQRLLEQLVQALEGHDDNSVLGVTSDHIGWEALADPEAHVHYLHVRDLRAILTALREARDAHAADRERIEALSRAVQRARGLLGLAIKDDAVRAVRDKPHRA